MTKEQLMERLYNYACDIVEGNIVACKKHIQACERFLNDLDRTENEDYPYYFDGETVFNFYEWSKMFKHTKGKLAAEGKHIELVDFQLFVIANIFGWKKRRNGTRRFRKSYIQVARKNAKSQLLALITSYEAFLSDEQGECYIAGVSREQSSIVYKEIADQLAEVRMLKNKYKEAYGRITTERKGSVIMPLSKEARKSGDGKNPSFCVIDEYHAHPTDEIYNVLLSGMAARPNGHICIITTAGFQVNESPCFSEYQYVSQILDEHNPVENDEYFVLIAELDENDDPKDEKNWAKANPIVASYEEGMDFLRGEMKSAIDNPRKMDNFLTKNMNIWIQDKAKNFIPLDIWNKCEEDFDLSELEGLPCIVGIDLSATIDLTSVSFVFSKDGIEYVHSHSFIPTETVDKKIKTDKVPYRHWADKGYITETNGAVVDYRYIERYILDIEKRYNLKILEICADPWNATQFMQNLESKGYTPIEIRQGFGTLSSPTKNFKQRVFAGELKHNGNPVLTWAVGNAIERNDPNENVMLDKAKSTNRIDPIASVINAHVRISTLENNFNASVNDHIMSEDFSF